VICVVFLHEQILEGCKEIGLQTTRKGGGAVYSLTNC
jgi:hypothetical protein